VARPAKQSIDCLDAYKNDDGYQTHAKLLPQNSKSIIAAPLSDRHRHPIEEP
jgi:hypothetical protein